MVCPETHPDGFGACTLEPGHWGEHSTGDDDFQFVWATSHTYPPITYPPPAVRR